MAFTLDVDMQEYIDNVLLSNPNEVYPHTDIAFRLTHPDPIGHSGNLSHDTQIAQRDYNVYLKSFLKLNPPKQSRLCRAPYNMTHLLWK